MRRREREPGIHRCRMHIQTIFYVTMTQYDHFKTFTFTVNITSPPPPRTRHYTLYTHITMASKVLLCRLCGGNAADKSMTNVFTRKSIERGWASRISTLLDISVSQSDLLQLVAIERRAHRHQIKGELETAIMIAEDNLLTMHLIASLFMEEHGRFTISENSLKIWCMRQRWISGSLSLPRIN